MALTVNSTYEESMGSNALYIINFASASTDTYTNLPLANNTIAYWANGSSGGATVNLNSTTGAFTITNNITGTSTLFVVAKQM